MNASPQPAPNAPGLIASTLSVVLGALAGGMIVGFAAASTGIDSGLMLVVVGAALGVFLRWQGFTGARALLSATLAMLLAFAYAEFLLGAVRIAQTLGLPMREVMSRADVALIGDVAIGNLHRREWTALALAIALAAATVLWPSRHA
jgi:hypothetical protein